MMDISAKIISEDIIRWRRELHQIPEIGNATKQTADYIRNELEKMNIPFKNCVNDCGIVAFIGNSTDKVVALRADIDGLPIEEKTGLPFASTNGYMHACGHDSHAAMALGTAKILKGMEAEIPGQVRIFFQPGEETGTGAKAMIADGILDEVKIDAIIAIHSMDVENLQNGSIMVSHGVQSASMDSFEIDIHGLGGHGAEPHKCVDVISTACQVVDAIYKIVSREVAPYEDVLLSVTSIRAGNDTYNILPDTAHLKGTYRTHSEEVRALIGKRIKEISEGVAQAMRAKADVRILEGIPCLVNDKSVVDTVTEAYLEVEGHQDILELPPHMGSEDASCFFDKIPGAYFVLNDIKSVEGKYYPAHNSRYDLDDSVLWIGTETEVRALLKLLSR